MQFALSADEWRQKILVEVVKRCFWNGVIIECWLAAFFDESVDFILGEFSVAVAGANV